MSRPKATIDSYMQAALFKLISKSLNLLTITIVMMLRIGSGLRLTLLPRCFKLLAYLSSTYMRQ